MTTDNAELDLVLQIQPTNAHARAIMNVHVQLMCFVVNYTS